MKSKTLFFYSLLLVSAIGIQCNNSSHDTLDSFEIEEGYTISLVASEPLIKDPVDLEFDELGHAYVLEMPGYPFEDTQSRIVKLLDINNDGIYDSNEIFAEQLELASSILPFRKGLLVAAPPYLLHLMDTNGDGQADSRDTLMSGFHTANLQHNYNGLSYGLDNWIYAANGGNSAKPFWWSDSTTVLDIKGDDLRFNLDTREMQRIGHSSGGFELGINEWGHIFETHNLHHLSQLVFPDRYIKDNRLSISHTLKNISDHEEDGLARIYPIGEQESRVNHPEQSGYFSGACGITYYGGGQLGSDYDNTVWIADVVLNLIHVDKLKPNSSHMKAERAVSSKDFLASTDRAFRPVNMTVGPDGAMYIVDMYRKVIEHPEWIPDEIEKDLDIDDGKDKGRIYKISLKTHQAKQIDYGNFSAKESLLQLLADKNQWVRNTAHRLLSDMTFTEQEFNILNEKIIDGTPYERQHAAWLLHVHEKFDQRLLDDPLSQIRENALIIAENHMENQSVLDKCIQLITDKNQRVRMQAALTISTLSETKYEENKLEIITQLIDAASLDMDQYNIAALTIASKYSFGELFTQSLKNSEVETNITTSLARAWAASDDAAMPKILSSMSKGKLKDEVVLDVLNSLTEVANKKHSSPSLTLAINKLEHRNDTDIINALALIRNKLDMPPSGAYAKLSTQALQSVLNKNLEDDTRLKQLSLLSLVSYEKKKEVLYSLLNNKEPLTLQKTVLEQLWKEDNAEVGNQLVTLWQALGPQARRIASDLLLYKESNHDALLTGLENEIINIGEMNFDLERRRTLLWWTDNEDTKRRAEALFDDAGVVNRKEVIEKMNPALAMNGDLQQGSEHFNMLCAQCHKYGNQGKNVGPVLTEINRKSKASLLHDILDPNAAVDTKYINHKLVTIDGDIHIGIVQSESDYDISIKKIGGDEITVSKKDVEQLSSLGNSMMPEGLESNLDHQQMADLLAFLQNPES